MKNKFLKLTLGILIFTMSIYAQNITKTVVPTKHNKNMTVGEIAEIQAGLGTIMIEFGYRFYVAYYAAKAENWELAKYEIDELIEAQEVAETTRPKYAKQLKAFENTFIQNLQNAIKVKDWNLFTKRYTQVTDACNNCHKVNKHPYIKYKLPKESPKYLRMNL